MALAMMTKHHLWLKRGLQELLKKDIPTALFCDSNAAIDVAYHFTREQIDKGNGSVIYVPLEENLADICTKGMTRYVNDHLCSKNIWIKVRRGIENMEVSTFLLLVFVPFFLFSISMEGLCG